MNERINYDQIAAVYDQVRRWGRGLSAQILQRAGIGPAETDRRILELGCGTGNVAANLEALTRAPVVALDLSRGMLDRAARKLRRSHLVRADAQCLPFGADRFHLVVAAMMIHHVQDWAALLAGCARVLVQRGMLVVVTTSHVQIGRHFLNRFFPSFSRVDRARFPDIPVIVRQMQAAGFEPVESCTVTVASYRPDPVYLEKVRRRHLSTFHLLDEAEFQRGLGEFAAYVRKTPDPPEMDHHGTLIWGTRV